MKDPIAEFCNSEIVQKTRGLYLLEHFELVGAFFNSNEPELRMPMIKRIINERGSFLKRYHLVICNDLEPKLRKKQMHFAQDEFDVKYIPAHDAGPEFFGCNILIISPPNPICPPLCARIILLFDDELKRQEYYTIERNLALSENEPPFVLGMWLPDETHIFPAAPAAFRELQEDDDGSTPDFPVFPNTSPDLPINKLPNRIKAELRAVYMFFSGAVDPQKGMDPRALEIVSEWQDAHPDEDLDSEELARLMKERYGEDANLE